MSLTTADLANINALFEGRFNAIDERFDAIDTQFKSVGTQFKAVDTSIENLATATMEQFEVVLSELSEMKNDVAVVKDYVKDHSFRLAKLEHRHHNSVTS